MTPPVAWSVAIGLAYLIGSLPFGFLTARLVAGLDIRQSGSGNIGATNVARVLGAKWGLLVLVLDGLKGLLPVTCLPRLLDPSATAPAASGAATHLDVAVGIATIVGHMFPCWLGFRGGKGVATALGVVAALDWLATICATAAFLATFGATRIVSLSSILAAASFAVAELVVLSRNGSPFAADRWSLAAFSLLVPCLIVLRHRANIVRLLHGKEPRFGTKAAPAADVEPDASRRE